MFGISEIQEDHICFTPRILDDCYEYPEIQEGMPLDDSGFQRGSAKLSQIPKVV